MGPDGAHLDGRNLAGQQVSAVRRVQPQVVNLAPPPVPVQVPVQVVTGPAPEFKHTVNAGPIWNNDDARGKCANLCPPPERWNGQWWTTIQGQMSVCECVGPAPQAYAPPPQAYAPPAPPPVLAMDERQFRGLRDRLSRAAFKDAQLNLLRDEANAGAHWNTQQVIVIMNDLTFGDAQVAGATILWPNVVDPQNFPAVVSSLTFEGDRQKLRRALGK